MPVVTFRGKIKTNDSSFKLCEIVSDKIIFFFQLVLHDPPGMGEWDHRIKKMVLFIEVTEKIKVFAFAHTESYAAINIEVQLRFNLGDYVRLK
mgnify:CR=1 FL=1